MSSVTASAITWALAVIGVISFVLAPIATPVKHSAESWRFRCDQAKAKCFDGLERKRAEHAQIKQDSARFVSDHTSSRP